MDKDRDEILNDLIKYYDADTKTETGSGTEQAETASADAPEEPDELGSTRIVRTPADTASGELGGDTIAVNINKPQPEKDSTIRIGSLPANEPPRTVPVKEEVLGNLGLDGLPITDTAANATPAEPEAYEPESHAGYDERDAAEGYGRDGEYLEYNEDEDGAETVYRRPRRGVWHALKPLWVTVILSGIIAAGFGFYMTDTGIIGTYKRNFEYNMNMLLDMFGISLEEPVLTPVESVDTSENTAEFETDVAVSSSGTAQSFQETDNVREEIPSEYRAVEKETHRLPFAEAGSSGFAVYDSGVVCAKSNYLSYLSASGNIKWELTTDVQDPILCASGDYIAIAAKNGTRLNLYKDSELQFALDADNRIISCSVSSRGDVVLITERPAYKGAVVVFNKRGEEIFSWSSGVNYITSASILRTRLVAVSLVNVETKVTSYLMVFDVDSPDPLAGAELTDTLVFDVFDNGRQIFTTGDNSISSMSEYCEVRYDKRFDNASLTHAAHDDSGSRAVAFTQDNVPVLNMYSKSGELIYSYSIENDPDFIDICKTTVLYNNGRDVICGKVNSENKYLYTAPMDIKDLLLLNSKAYIIIYENSIEIIRI